MLNKLLNRINSIDKFYIAENGRRDELYRQLKSKKKTNKKLKKENKDIEKCIMLLDYITANTEGKIIELFQSTISAALKDIFDDSYDFRFNFKKRGNVSSCDYEIRSSEFPEWHNIKMCNGKSVHQIIALALRTIIVKLDKSSPDIIGFDEPLDGLRPERQRIAGEFINNLCKTYGMQFITVTHSDELADQADKRMEVK